MNGVDRWVRNLRDSAYGAAGRYPEQYHRIWLRRLGRREHLTPWNRQHGALFIHVPKAAGSAVMDALGMPRVSAHCPASAYKAHYPEFYEAAFTFCFVRNPWDRLVSAFHFIRFDTKRSYNVQTAANLFPGIDSFEQFLEALRGSYYRNLVMTKMHFMTQSSFITDSTGAVIVDHVGRLERISEDFRHVTERIGIAATLEKSNRSERSRADYRSYYDAEWKRELVARMYAEDVERFDYRFAPLGAA